MQKKEFYTIAEAAKKLKCSEVNVYHHIKTKSLTIVNLPTFIKTDGGDQATGKTEKYITAESLLARVKGKGRISKKGKQIGAKYIKEGKTFENGKPEIVFPSETVAAEKLQIGKFALRYRLKKGSLIRDEIKVFAI